jgi:hypothetical protein
MVTALHQAQVAGAERVKLAETVLSMLVVEALEPLVELAQLAMAETQAHLVLATAEVVAEALTATMAQVEQVEP